MKLKVTITTYIDVDPDRGVGALRRECNQFAMHDLPELLQDGHDVEATLLCEPTIELEKVE